LSPEGAFESLAKGGVKVRISFPSFLGKIEADIDSWNPELRAFR